MGRCNGLYATTNDTGGLTCIEVQLIPSESKLSLELTGQQGKIMKESMQVAKTLAWNLIDNKLKENIKKEFDLTKSQGIHIHVPEGATPKDGPSAGIAMVTSIVSSITGIPANREIAMTGEVTITGQVLAIGGLKEKLLAAHRAGIKHVLIPNENEKDLVDIPEKVKKDIKITPVKHVDEVLKLALTKELKRVEWVDVQDIAKSKKEEDSEKILTN